MKKNILTTAAFVAVGIVLFLMLQNLFGVSNNFSEHTEMMFNGYYEEPEDTVDAVLIGNSHIYRFWQGAFAWQEHGMSSLAFSSSDMPCSIYQNMAVEALKTQTPRVLVLDCTAFAKAEAEENNKIYLVMQNMKFSQNYLDMLENYFAYTHMGPLGRLLHYFPFFRFHSRWQELNTRDFVQTLPSYLNSCYLDGFLKEIYVGEHIVTEKRQTIAPEAETSLRKLLDWCQTQEVPVLFIASPVLLSEEEMALINYTGDVIREYGLAFINFNDEEEFERFGFELQTDFSDKSHTNINGSYKFTKIFGAYLMEQYGMADHRSEAAYGSWEERTQAYMEMVQEYFS